jgi:uncharacterized membrane protein YhhN
MNTENNFKFFIGISAIYILLICFGYEDFAWYMKPFLLPFLFYAVVKTNEFETKRWLLLSLLFSWIGDCVLMFADQGELYFIFGLVSFLLAHVLFIVLFVKQKSDGIHHKQTLYWFGFSFVLVYLFGMLSLLIPSLGDLKFPVGIYAMTISLMLIETLKGSFNWSDKSKYIVLIGAIFFVTSDSILAINKFYTAISNASFWIMITYLIALFCIVKGILKMNNNVKIGY